MDVYKKLMMRKKVPLISVLRIISIDGILASPHLCMRVVRSWLSRCSSYSITCRMATFATSYGNHDGVESFWRQWNGHASLAADAKVMIED